MKKRSMCILLITVLLLVTLCPVAVFGSGVQLKKNVRMDAGEAVVSWTGDTSSIYYAFVQCQDPMNGGEQPMQMAGLGYFGELRTGMMIPGHTYKLMLVDSNYSVQDSAIYSIPSAYAFEDGRLKDTSFKISVQSRKRNTDGSYKNIEFMATNISKDLKSGSASYGFKYTIQMPQLAKPRTFYTQIAIISPNGMVYTWGADDVTFDRVNGGYQTIWWDFVGADFFEELMDACGAVPPGKYTFELYCDGMLANRSYYSVK